MTDNLTRAPAQDEIHDRAIDAGQAWLKEQKRKSWLANRIGSIGEAIAVEAYTAGCLAGVAEGRSVEALEVLFRAHGALTTANALIVEVAALLRGYERHHRDKMALAASEAEARESCVKAERNAEMAGRLEAWLNPGRAVLPEPEPEQIDGPPLCVISTADPMFDPSASVVINGYRYNPGAR